jgi:hypothetical protein
MNPTKISPEENADLQQPLNWADEIHRETGLQISGNADSSESVTREQTLGADGIGRYK